MKSNDRGKRLAIWTAAVVVGLIVYILGIRGLLFGFLYEQGMMDWYGNVIDGFNRLTRSSHADGEHPLDEYRQRTDVWLFQIAALVAVVLAIRYATVTRERRILLGVNLLLLSIVLVGAELVLRTDGMQRAIGGLKYMELDQAISRKHMKAQNDLGFTDRERSRSRNDRAYRIAVLGDSFVWGDGLSDLSAVWSHRMEDRLVELFGDDVEVLSWGKRGWSTFSEVDFLQSEGSEFDIDLLIIGYVSNDPHIPGESMPRRMFVWDKVAMKALPFIDNVIHLVSTTMNSFLYSLPYFHNWGYEAWKRELYSDANLARYELVLKTLQEHLKERQVDYLFVITPTMQDPGYADQFVKLLDLFERLGVPYLDLRPVLESRFGDYSASRVRRELWANPADGHPSEVLHEMYAEETLRYLMTTDLPGIITSRQPAGSGDEPAPAGENAANRSSGKTE